MQQPWTCQDFLPQYRVSVTKNICQRERESNCKKVQQKKVLQQFQNLTSSRSTSRILWRQQTFFSLCTSLHHMKYSANTQFTWVPIEPVEPIREMGFGPFRFTTSSATALPGHAGGGPFEEEEPWTEHRTDCVETFISNAAAPLLLCWPEIQPPNPCAGKMYHQLKMLPSLSSSLLSSLSHENFSIRIYQCTSLWREAWTNNHQQKTVWAPVPIPLSSFSTNLALLILVLILSIILQINSCSKEWETKYLGVCSQQTWTHQRSLTLLLSHSAHDPPPKNKTKNPTTHSHQTTRTETKGWTYSFLLNKPKNKLTQNTVCKRNTPISHTHTHPHTIHRFQQTQNSLTEALEEMVKGPVPVSPAIAATFNAMTPSGAQLTSSFFFFQLPKKLLPNRTQKKEL